MGIKICHMTSAHSSLDVRIFEKECRSLSKAGYDTFLVAQGTSFEKDGVKICGTGKKYTSRLKRMLCSPRDVYKEGLNLNAQIYHIHDPELLPYALKLKKRSKIVIFDSHEDLPRQILSKGYIPGPFRRIVSIMIEKYEGYILKQLDCVVAATPHIAEILKNYNSNVEVLYNYPILEDYKTNRSESTKKILCYCGGISEERGITQLLMAIEKLDVKLLLAGNLSNKYRDSLMQLPGWKKVLYLGMLSRKQVSLMYQNSSIGLCILHDTPNNRYGLPNKMFEYMASGLPIICSEFPLWKAIIEGNNCGICVNPMDTDKIAYSIELLLRDKETMSQMGENGRKAIEKRYNWEDQADSLLSLYHELENRRPL